MALQTSGPISLNDIQAEFGGSAPTSITEYYRGGSLVPDTVANSGIPTSGTISLTDFYGAVAAPPVTVTLTNRTVAISSDFLSTQAYVLFETNGTLVIPNGLGGTTLITGEWATPVTAGVGSNYQVRATLSTGTTPTGPALGTWWTINTARQWSVTDTIADSVPVTSTIVISIRDVATSTIQDTATITLSSNQESIR
jgi:hypothetical protein